MNSQEVEGIVLGSFSIKFKASYSRTFIFPFMGWRKIWWFDLGQKTVLPFQIQDLYEINFFNFKTGCFYFHLSVQEYIVRTSIPNAEIF